MDDRNVAPSLQGELRNPRSSVPPGPSVSRNEGGGRGLEIPGPSGSDSGRGQVTQRVSGHGFAPLPLPPRHRPSRRASAPTTRGLTGRDLFPSSAAVLSRPLRGRLYGGTVDIG